MNSEIILGDILLMLGVIIIIVTIFYTFHRKDEMIIFKTILLFVGAIFVIFGVVLISDNNVKFCMEYLRGNIDVKYEKIYVDSTLIMIDTIITYKK